MTPDDQLRAELDAVKAQRDEASKQLLELCEDNESLTVMNAQHEAELATLRARLVEVERERDTLAADKQRIVEWTRKLQADIRTAGQVAVGIGLREGIAANYAALTTATARLGDAGGAARCHKSRYLRT